MPVKHTAKISSKGQVTVPIAIRKRLGVRAGDRIEFVAERNHTLLRPATKPLPSFSKYAGALGNLYPRGRRQVNAWISELRDDDK